jgi:O-antigen/teichoic acid export membrane protein
MSIKRQFLWSMAPLLVISVVNLVSVRLFYRYLGPEMYALWFYVIALGGFFGFMDMGLGMAMGRYIGIALGKDDREAVRQYWGTGNLMAIPVLLAMTVVFMGIGIVFGPKWFHVSPENVHLLQWAFVGGGCGMFLSYYTQFWLILSQAHFDFKFIGLLCSVVGLVQVLASIWLAYLTGNPVVLIFAGLLFGLFQLGLFMWHAHKNYQLGFNLRDASIARAREMFAVSSKVFGTILANALGGSMDRLLLGKIVPPVAFAHYNICYSFAARIMGLGGAIMGPVFHQTSRAVGKDSRASVAAIYNETFDFTFGWYALAAIWTVFWHPIFLRLVLGQELALQVTPAFTPLVIAFCLSGVAAISTAQLVPLNRAGVGLGFGILNAIFLGLFVITGWFWDGLSGVAWGVLASRIVVVAQDLYVIRLVGGGGWLALRTWRHLLAQCAVGVAVFAASWLLLPQSPYWKIAPAVLHGTLVVGWLLRHQLRKFIVPVDQA